MLCSKCFCVPNATKYIKPKSLSMQAIILQVFTSSTLHNCYSQLLFPALNSQSSAMCRTSQHPSTVCTQTAVLQHPSFSSYHYTAVISVNCFVPVKFYGILWTIFAVWKLILMFSFHALLITNSQHSTIQTHNDDDFCGLKHVGRLSVVIYIHIYIYISHYITTLSFSTCFNPQRIIIMEKNQLILHKI
jgi:hypothetical protein